MGGAGGKLKAWAGFQYGTAVGNLPGDCENCRKAHQMLPVKRPPCDRLAADHPQQCPKYKLCPEGNGLHPKNRLALQMYVLASHDIRAGMDGCLIGTLTPADAKAVLDLYAEHMPTSLARQRTFELMIVLDQVITARRAEREAATSQAALFAAKNRGNRRA